MNLLENGAFQKDLNDPENGWEVTGFVERVGDVGQYGHSNYAHFEGSGHLIQTVRLYDPKPERLELSLDLRVQNGDDGLNGSVQVVVALFPQSGAPDIRNYVVREYSTWQTARVLLPSPTPFLSVTLNFAVLGRSDKVISLRNISLADDQAQGIVEQTRHHGHQGHQGRQEERQEIKQELEDIKRILKNIEKSIHNTSKC